MKERAALLNRDQNHVWHPCSQMKDYVLFKPLIVTSAYGSHITLADGRNIIDAISSWWCKSLGHQHPRLKEALLQQANRFEHVILANTTNDVIVELSEKLAQLSPSLSKVFYAGDGSCAVEIAMKMSLHARQIQGSSQRKTFIALENAYHGETLGALSVSDVGRFREPYQAALFKTHFITSLPYVANTHDPLWLDCDSHWHHLKSQLEPLADTATALLIEPIVQGAAGMRIYSQDLLKRLRQWTNDHDIHLIADEIMTGIGRTGKMLACEHAGIEPDMICLSKGLTSGWMPFSAVITRQSIYDYFYDDDPAKAFLHSHTYSGNALAASIAIEVLNTMSDESILDHVKTIETVMSTNMQDIAKHTGKLSNLRGIGAIMAADIIPDSRSTRTSLDIFQKAAQLGALLRPIGNTLYWLPPLNCDIETLMRLKEITQNALLL